MIMRSGKTDQTDAEKDVSKMREIIITAENQRRIMKVSYDASIFSEDLTGKETVLMALGDFYTRQTTYTRLVSVVTVDENGDETEWYQK